MINACLARAESGDRADAEGLAEGLAEGVESVVQRWHG